MHAKFHNISPFLLCYFLLYSSQILFASILFLKAMYNYHLAASKIAWVNGKAVTFEGDGFP